MVLFCWTFLSVLDVITVLENKDQTRLLAIYRLFNRVLVSLVLTVSVYQLFLKRLFTRLVVRRFWKLDWL